VFGQAACSGRVAAGHWLQATAPGIEPALISATTCPRSVSAPRNPNPYPNPNPNPKPNPNPYPNPSPPTSPQTSHLRTPPQRARGRWSSPTCPSTQTPARRPACNGTTRWAASWGAWETCPCFILGTARWLQSAKCCAWSRQRLPWHALRRRKGSAPSSHRARALCLDAFVPPASTSIPWTFTTWATWQGDGAAMLRTCMCRSCLARCGAQATWWPRLQGTHTRTGIASECAHHFGSPQRREADVQETLWVASLTGFCQ